MSHCDAQTYRNRQFLPGESLQFQKGQREKNEK